MSEARTVVMIHGLWITAASWAPWAERYRAAGHEVLTPAWPTMDLPVEELRRDPSGTLRLTVPQLVDHFAGIVRDLDRPILIGHSFGGMLVQLLLDRGLGAAGVAMCSAGVRGVYGVSMSQLRVLGPILANPANRRRPVPVTAEGFHASAANAMSAADAAAAHAEHIIPAPGGLVFALGTMNRPRSPLTVNLRNPDRVPLLFIAGGADRMSPPRYVRENARRQAKAGALTAYREFPDRSHFVGQPGWEVVADFALGWARGADRLRRQLSSTGAVGRRRPRRHCLRLDAAPARRRCPARAFGNVPRGDATASASKQE